MTILELATQVGSDVGNLSRLERGLQGYSQDALEKIAAALGVQVATLFSEEVGASSPPPTGKVPLVSWVAAGKWCQVNLPFEPGEAEEWLPCPVKHGPRTYALRVRGDSMHNPNGRPSFDHGDIIFVDPDREAVHRSLAVICLDDDNQATFKRVLIDGAHMMLEALNPAWPNRIFEVSSNASICGVVIARMESFI